MSRAHATVSWVLLCTCFSQFACALEATAGGADVVRLEAPKTAGPNQAQSALDTEHGEFRGIISQKRKAAEEVMNAEHARVQKRMQEKMRRAMVHERQDKKSAVDDENEAHRIKKMEEKAEKKATDLPVVPAETAAAQSKNDPGAATSDERILLLKEKIKAARMRTAYAKQSAVANDMKEMSFKVEAGSDEAKKAQATVEQVKEKLPSVEEMANERLKKSRDRFEMKELEEKAKGHAKAPTPESTTQKQHRGDGKGEGSGARPQFVGAEVAVELKNAMNEAKQALLHKDNNPGDKEAEIKAGEAMQRVASLTKRQQDAIVTDANLKKDTDHEMEMKALKVRADNEQWHKKVEVKKQIQYAAQQKVIDAKLNQKENLQKEVQNADKNLQIEKQLAELAEQREQQKLIRDEWESREQANKEDVKQVETDKVKMIKMREQNVKMTDKTKEREKKKTSQERESEEKDLVNEMDKLKRDEKLQQKMLEKDKASVIQAIQSAQKFQQQTVAAEADEAKQVKELAKEASVGEGSEFSKADVNVEEKKQEIAAERKKEKAVLQQESDAVKKEVSAYKTVADAMPEGPKKDEKMTEYAEKKTEGEEEMKAAKEAEDSKLEEKEAEVESEGEPGKVRAMENEFKEKAQQRKKHEQKKMARVVGKITKQEATAADKLKQDKDKVNKTKSKLDKLAVKDEADKENAAVEAEKAKKKLDEAQVKASTDQKMSVYEEDLKNKVRLEVNGPFKTALQQAMRQDVHMKADLDTEMEDPELKKETDKEIARILAKRLAKRVYTVAEARRLRALVVAEVNNEQRNVIWSKIVSKEKAAGSGEGASDKEGIFLKKGHQLSRPWSQASEDRQKNIQADMDLLEKQKQQRKNAAMIREEEEESKDVDPREVLNGGPKPWYNRTHV